MSKYIPGIGPIGARLMIIGEAPNDSDVETGKPFSGSLGKQLDALLIEAGTNRSQVWLSNVCKYPIPPSPRGKKVPFPVRVKMAGHDVKVSLEELQNEINSIEPNAILSLGAGALWALTGKGVKLAKKDRDPLDPKEDKIKSGISSYRGSIMWGMGRKVIPTYNPAGLINSPDAEFAGYWNKQIILFDIRRALKQSQFPNLILPTRNLQVLRNSYQLAEFKQLYRNHSRPAVDIEAGGTCLPICIGLSFVPSHGLTVPLWNRDGISNIPDSDLVQCWILLDEILSNNDIVGQNFKYDQDKIRRLGFTIKRLVSDTMLKAFAINPELPKGLGFNTSLYTEEPYYKDEGMYHGKLDDLFIGCARDACVTKEIDMNMDADLDELGMRDYYENFILPLHDLYLDIENVGFRVDTVARDRLVKKYVAWDERLGYELFKIIGEEVNVNSNKQIPELLYDKWKLPAKKGASEEVITELLNSPRVKDQNIRRGLELILERRKVKKSISTYLMAAPDFDGRMKTTYFLCLETGRTSTGQQDPPIRPDFEVLNERGEKKKKVLGIAFQTMTKHGDIGADIREQYIPDEGEVFVNIDSSQAEARVVALLANDEDTLGLYDSHDIHALTASWFFGGCEDDYSKKKLGYESPIRFAGKTLRHAGHLGAGARRASVELNTQARKYKIDIRITQAVAERALNIFHQKSPKIRQVFHHEVIESLQRNKRRLVAPVPYGIDSYNGGIRTFYERWGDELFRQAFSYLPQRAVSDNTKAAALRIKKRLPNIKIILEAHDALLFSIHTRLLDDYIPILQEEMERPIRFDSCSLPRHELVIPSDVEIGYNYMELTKWKKKVA